jgi:hypothetical protein
MDPPWGYPCGVPLLCAIDWPRRWERRGFCLGRSETDGTRIDATIGASAARIRHSARQSGNSYGVAARRGRYLPWGHPICGSDFAPALSSLLGFSLQLLDCSPKASPCPVQTHLGVHSKPCSREHVCTSLLPGLSTQPTAAASHHSNRVVPVGGFGRTLVCGIAKSWNRGCTRS